MTTATRTRTVPPRLVTLARRAQLPDMIPHPDDDRRRIDAILRALARRACPDAALDGVIVYQGANDEVRIRFLHNHTLHAASTQDLAFDDSGALVLATEPRTPPVGIWNEALGTFVRYGRFIEPFDYLFSPGAPDE